MEETKIDFALTLAGGGRPAPFEDSAKPWSVVGQQAAMESEKFWEGRAGDELQSEAVKVVDLQDLSDFGVHAPAHGAAGSPV